MFDSLFPKEWTTLQRLMWLKTNALARAVYEIVTGNPVSFTAKAAPLKQLQIAFSPVQSGTGDPSPDNVRPISGWSSLTVEQRGKNLFDAFDGEGSAITPSYVYAYPNFLKAGTYTISCVNQINPSATNKGARLRFVAADKSTKVGDDPAPYSFGDSVFSRTFTVTEEQANAPYLRWDFRTGTADMPQSLADAKVMIELGSTPSTFVPYNPSSRSISISLGETVYSGWVDVISGVGGNASYGFVMDGTSSADCNMYDTGTAGYKRLGILIANSRRPRAKKTSGSSVVGNIKCNIFKSISADAVYMRNTGIAQSRNGDVLTMYREGLQTVQDWMTFFSENPMQVVYEVDEPIPIQLTPQEVQSLAGDNVLFSDANGNLTVEYRSN